jgi:hypothetical protein
MGMIPDGVADLPLSRSARVGDLRVHALEAGLQRLPEAEAAAQSTRRASTPTPQDGDVARLSVLSRGVAGVHTNSASGFRQWVSRPS